MIWLNLAEQNQLGSLRCLKNGKPAAHAWPTQEQWPQIRELLVKRSLKANPALDLELTAYTPGETLQLLDHDVIKAWHQSCVKPIPAGYEALVLVPCAKTKPWMGPAINKSRLYSAYNQLMMEMPNVCFATVSEPLGIVAMQDWMDFPQYDNPGLFTDDAQQSGMTRLQWQATEFGSWLGLPFDAVAWRQCIDHLGAVVGDFLQTNQDLKIFSFVDNLQGPQSTHGAMLDVAQAASGSQVQRHAKRNAPRVSPLQYMRNILSAG